ncbi:DDE-type integrase/transposase/recombinase [Candidatus Poribacteria bacterium]
MLALRDHGMSIVAISQQYHTPRCTFYYWLSRYEEYHTYENRSSVPHRIYRKVTEEIKAAVLEKYSKNRRLGRWRLSQFEYEGQSLGSTTIWLILVEARQTRLPPQSHYYLTHAHQIWFIDHMHLRTLPNGQKIYSLIVLDGFSRVLLSHEVCLSKGAREACLVLLRAFAHWGLPEEILSDNGGAFISLLYRLFLGVLRVKVSYTTPGCPWENPFAESFIGTLRAYFYPHLQRQRTAAGIQRVYSEKTDYYNDRVHWEFRNDKIKTPLGKLDSVKGRSMPDDFELRFLATGKRYTRTVDGQGRISWKRYRLYVRGELKKEKIEIREFFDSLVVIYQSGTVVSYACTHERSQIASVPNTPVFHAHPGIESTKQLELFDCSHFQLRYVNHRPPNQKHPQGNAIQLLMEDLV